MTHTHTHAHTHTHTHTHTQSLIAKTDQFAQKGEIDATSNLAKASVWLYSGTKDTVVKTGVMDKLKSFYSHYVTQGVVDSDFTQASEHGWPTLDYGIACTRLGSPYILKCDYDAAGKVLKNAYPDLKPAGSECIKEYMKICV